MVYSSRELINEAVIQKPSNVFNMPLSLERGLFDLPNCTFTATSLFIKPGMPINDWIELGRRLNRADGSLSVWRGDWINYGKHEYGKKYDDAVALTGLKKSTLSNDVWIARAIDPSLRSEKLTARHYKELAPLRSKKRIQKWIERATEGVKVWSHIRLRKEILRASTRPVKVEDKNYLEPDYKQFLIDYISGQESFLTKCTYDPFKRELERTIKRAKFQLDRTETSDYEAVRKQIDEGASTIEEIAEEVPISETEIDSFCERAVGCRRPTSRTDQREAGSEYEWRPIGVKIAIGKGVRPHGVFRKDAPGGDDFDSGYHPQVSYGEEEDHF